MDASLRNAKDVHEKLSSLQGDLTRRFMNLVSLAEVKYSTRGVSAVTQYQIQVETAALIRAAEEVQTMIRHMQEMWLFGQLNTLGESKVQKETDENAQIVAGLLRQLTEKKFGPKLQMDETKDTKGENGVDGTNGMHVD